MLCNYRTGLETRHSYGQTVLIRFISNTMDFLSCSIQGPVSTRPLFAEIHNRGKGHGAAGFQMASQLCAATSVISKTSTSEMSPPWRFKKRQNKYHLFTNNQADALNSSTNLDIVQKKYKKTVSQQYFLCSTKNTSMVGN